MTKRSSSTTTPPPAPTKKRIRKPMSARKLPGINMKLTYGRTPAVPPNTPTDFKPSEGSQVANTSPFIKDTTHQASPSTLSAAISTAAPKTPDRQQNAAAQGRNNASSPHTPIFTVPMSPIQPLSTRNDKKNATSESTDGDEDDELQPTPSKPPRLSKNASKKDSGDEADTLGPNQEESLSTTPEDLDSPDDECERENEEEAENSEGDRYGASQPTTPDTTGLNDVLEKAPGNQDEVTENEARLN